MQAWLAHTLSYLSAPIAALWVGHHEVIIRSTGRRLNEKELEHCQKLGIQQAEDIRVKVVARVPSPVPCWLERLCQKLGFPVGSAAGICFRYGIYLDERYSGNPSLLRHELVHTAQYERFGSLKAFLKTYLFECLHFGYSKSPLEIEAQEPQ
ncbi:hypothetical protein Rhal01_02445 [Rubritalea halochordaticola]|uniref:DUF4157 domain-containing protein n=1 Tax=Rubritalea halochordaticola TaxID=714537 RepID=A0ABP9V4J2_9BACT